MPNWKKVVTSGSNAHLNQITASNATLAGDLTANNITVTNDINLGGNDHIRFASDQGFSLASTTSETFQISKGDDDNDIYLAVDGNTTARVTIPKVLELTGTTDATDASGDTGILRVEGGASIAKKVFVGTDLSVGNNITASGNISSSGDLQSSKLTIVKKGASSNEKLISLTGGAGSEKFSVDEDGDVVGTTFSNGTLTITSDAITRGGDTFFQIGNTGLFYEAAAGHTISFNQNQTAKEFFINTTNEEYSFAITGSTGAVGLGYDINNLAAS